MINTIFPRFLAITSPVCRYGMIGRKMERVLAIIECDENIKDGIIAVNPSEISFVSAEPGIYEHIECEVKDVFGDGKPLEDVVGNFKLDIAMMIKSENV